MISDSNSTSKSTKAPNTAWKKLKITLELPLSLYHKMEEYKNTHGHKSTAELLRDLIRRAVERDGRDDSAR